MFEKILVYSQVYQLNPRFNWNILYYVRLDQMDFMESVRFCWALLYFPLDLTLRKIFPQDKEHQPEGRKPSQEEH